MPLIVTYLRIDLKTLNPILKKLLKSIKGIYTALLVTSIVIITGTLGFIIIEKWSLFDALYMTIITISTVGYGEVKPLSHYGRMFAIVLIFFGSMMLGLSLAIITTFVLEVNLSGNWAKKKMQKDIDHLHNHYIICGAGNVGEHVIARFCKTYLNFVVIEQREEQLASLNKKYEQMKYYFAGDATDEDTLRWAGIERAKGIITTLPNDAAN